MKCFIYRKNEVLGPFDESELEGCIDVDDRIWALGSKSDEWLTKEDWYKSKDEIAKNLDDSTQSVDWYMVITDDRLGPMAKTDIIEALSDMEDLKEIYLWNKNLTTWTSIYKFKDILAEIGKENRKNLRVELHETVVFTKIDELDSHSVICKATSLSSEGLGIIGAPKGIHIGDEINIGLSFIDASLSVRCRVIFRNNTNHSLNLKFSSLQGEAKSLIVDYLNLQLGESRSSKAA